MLHNHQTKLRCYYKFCYLYKIVYKIIKIPKRLMKINFYKMILKHTISCRVDVSTYLKWYKTQTFANHLQLKHYTTLTLIMKTAMTQTIFLCMPKVFKTF